MSLTECHRLNTKFLVPVTRLLLCTLHVIRLPLTLSLSLTVYYVCFISNVDVHVDDDDDEK